MDNGRLILDRLTLAALCVGMRLRRPIVHVSVSFLPVCFAALSAKHKSPITLWTFMYRLSDEDDVSAL